MRRPIIPLALVLALTTGVILNQTRLVALAPIAVVGVAPADSPTGVVVRHFYAAVNTALITGDLTALAAVVDPAFVDHVPRPGITPDRTGLLAYLDLLRASAPDLRLVPDRLFAEEDRVVALVTVDGAAPSPVPGIRRGVERPWGTLDVFGIEGDRIVEHWGDAAGLSHAVPLLDVTIPTVAPVGSIVELDRQTLPPGSVWQPVASGPTVVLVEAGTLAVELLSRTTDASVARAGQAPAPLPPAQQVRVAAGDAVALPPGASARVVAGEAEPAVALVLWAAPQTRAVVIGIATTAIGTQTEQPRPPFADETPAAVAGGLSADLPGGGVQVTMTRVTLAPGAALAARRVAVAEFALVAAGMVAVTTDGGIAWVRDGPGGALRGRADADLGPGSGAQVQAGATLSYRAVGEAPAEVLLVTVKTRGVTVPVATPLPAA